MITDSGRSLPSNTLSATEAVEFRIVDDDLYMRVDGLLSEIADEIATEAPAPASDGERRWKSARDVDQEQLEAGGPSVTSLLESMAETLSVVTVDGPGESTEIDGEPVTRFEADLDGDVALQLLTDLSVTSNGEDLAAQYPGSEDRIDALMDYILTRTHGRVIVHLDSDGELVHAEITVSVEVEAVADCEPLAYGPGTVHMVMDQLNEPQGIEAPPDEEVEIADDLSADTYPDEDGTDLADDRIDLDEGGTDDITPDDDGLGDLADSIDEFVAESKLAGCPVD